MVGADAHHATSVLGAVAAGFRRHRREERRRQRPGACELLEFVGIARERPSEAARNLPYGDQRRLEIARALATEPKLLLLDEPAAGFNPAEKRELMDLIRQIRDAGCTVLLIEHDMSLVMGICDRIAVLDFGEKIAEGPPAEVRERPDGSSRPTWERRPMLLELEDMHVHYGKIEALKGIVVRRSTRARSSRSSAPTAPARPRR